MKFQVNEGPIDRLIRILVGVGLFMVAAAGLVTPPVLYGVLLLGTIGLVTGITGFCPTYVLLGISTVRKKAADDASPGTLNDSGKAREDFRTRMEFPAAEMSAPRRARSRSVWSLLLSGSRTVVRPLAYSPASNTQDLTCALATGDS